MLKLKMILILIVVFTQGAFFCISLDNVEKKDELISNNENWNLEKGNTIVNSRSPRAPTLDDTNLVANWRLNEGSGISASDSTGNGHDGVIDGAEWLPGYQAQGLDFEFADTDFITINDHNDLSFTYDNGTDKPFSISSWFKLESNTGSGQTIITKDDAVWGFREWTLSLNTNLEIQFMILDNSAMSLERIVSDDALSSNLWYFIVATYNGVGGVTASTGMNLYINGTLIASTSNDGGTYVAMENSSEDSRIGAYGNGAGTIGYFDGIIDETRLYNKTLSQAEINELYNYTIASIDSETIGLNDYNFTASFEGELSGEQMNYSLHVRANDTEITSSDKVSNASGVSFFNHAAAIESLEYTLRITNAHYIHELYFQPRTINHFDYATDQGDMWDFSEDTDGWSFILDKSTEILKGYASVISEKGVAHMYIIMANFNWDITYYTNIQLRFRINETTQDIKLRCQQRDLTGKIISETIDNTTWNYWNIDVSGWDSGSSRLRFDIMAFGDFDTDFTQNIDFQVDYIRFCHEDTPVIKDATSEFWLTSQNDSYTYSYTYLSSTSSTTDLSHISKTTNGLKTVSYTAYLDSNYPTSILLPYSSSDTVLLDGVENKGLEPTLKAFIEVIIILGIFSLALILSLVFVYKIFKGAIT